MRRPHGNLGQTSLRQRRRSEDPMRDYDRLPPDLRAWIAAAALPWRPRSVRQAFDKALAETGDRALALARLDAVQRRLLARDAPAVWGPGHPAEGDAGTPDQRAMVCTPDDARPLPDDARSDSPSGMAGSRVAVWTGAVSALCAPAMTPIAFAHRPVETDLRLSGARIVA